MGEFLKGGDKCMKNGDCLIHFPPCYADQRLA